MQLDYDIDEVRKEIIADFAHHWELNDRGHQREHFEAVFQTGRHISICLGLEKQIKEVDILFAAYFHDFFAWTRVNHHEMAYQYFMTADHPLIMKYYPDDPAGKIRRSLVAFGCREHRASYKGAFTTLFSELINSADRCFPGDVQALLKRTYDHRLSTHPDISEDERMALCVGHMKEKAGSKGYARYPDLYMQVFGEKLKEQMEEIDNLNYKDGIWKLAK